MRYWMDFQIRNSKISSQEIRLPDFCDLVGFSCEEDDIGVVGYGCFP